MTGTPLPTRIDPYAVLVLAVAGTVLLVGHGLGVEPLTRLLPGGSPMVPSTALCLTLLALGLIVRTRGEAGIIAARSVAIAVLIVALASLALDLTPGAQGLDPLILGHPANGRMALVGAVAFALAALSLLTLTVPALSGRAAWHALPTVGLILAGIALMGYALDRRALLTVLPFAPMAIHTALLFVLLFLALMRAAPHPGWLGLLRRSPRIGNRNARRVLPAILILPFLLADGLLFLVRRQDLDPAFALTVLAVLISALFGAVNVLNARLLNRQGDRLTEAIAALDAALAERNVLLAEVYHRVKNNLQQIEALLATEARKHRRNRAAMDSFDAMSARIRSVAVVHRLLLQRKSLDRVPLSAFLETLAETMSTAGGLSLRRIEITVDAPPIEVSLSAATTLGLLVNEIVANSLKHAFPPDGPGTIAITVDDDPSDPDRLRLRIADDGRGYDPVLRPTGTGSRIIRALATQVRAEMSQTSQDGVQTLLLIPRGMLEEQR